MRRQDESVTSISCGAEHTVAATARGEVFAWGWGRYGNLGDGERVDRCAPCLRSRKPESLNTLLPCPKVANATLCARWLPTRVESLAAAGVSITTVACGWRHSVVFNDSGAVYTFGWSKYGQLGHGDRE